MKQLDWYNEAHISMLARLEAGIFLKPSVEKQKEHFDILESHFFHLFSHDFKKFKQAAIDFGYLVLDLSQEYNHPFSIAP